MFLRMFNVQGLLKTSQFMCTSKCIHDVKKLKSFSPLCSKNAQRFLSESKNWKRLDFSKQENTLFIAPKVCTREQRLFIHSTTICSAEDMSNSTLESTIRTKEELFFSATVQAHLSRLTGMDYNRIFRVEKLGQPITAPKYQFLTDQELKEAQNQAEKSAKKLLQMPPVMNERDKASEVLDHDSAIEGYDSAKLVFTDITYGIHDRERLIVVREPDGTLRHAKGEECDRLNQIYFPHPGRKVYVPAMFKKDNLEDILSPERYLYILNRNCEQFEPDNPIYINTAESVYEHIYVNSTYDELWSTRHFGPMLFHLVWEKKCDDLIVWYLTRRKENALSEVLDVLMVYSYIHSSSKFAETIQAMTPMIRDIDVADWKISQADQLQLIRAFIEFASTKAQKIHSALESYLEIREKQTTAKEVQKSN